MTASTLVVLRRSHRPRTRANLAATIAITCCGCGQVATAPSEEEPNQRRAVAQYSVDRPRWHGFEDDFTAEDEAKHRATQAAYVRSPFVLTAAVGSAGIAKLPLLAEQEEPVDWLADHLTVGYPANGRLLEIKLADEEAPLADLKKIVEAVSRAYYEEVVFRDRSMRQQPLMVLQRTRQKTREQRLRKATELRELLRDSNDGASEAEQHLLRDEVRLLRRERLWTERRIIEQGKESTTGPNANRDEAPGSAAAATSERPGPSAPSPNDAWSERLAKLDARIAAAIERLVSQPRVPDDVAELRRELARLEASEDRLADRIEALQLNLQAPPRVVAVGGAGSGYARAATFPGDASD